MNQTDFDPTIDPHALDREWLRQAPMYYASAVRLADARREVEEAKREADVALAEAILDIRRDPAKYNLEKPSVDIIKAAAEVHHDYTCALAALTEARHAADVAQAETGSLDHKKRALENMVSLEGRNYFAEPRAQTEEARNGMAEAGKKAARAKGTRQHPPAKTAPEPEPEEEEIF